MTKPIAASTTFHILPLPGFIICEELKDEGRTSGVVVADTAATKDSGGVVIAVGASFMDCDFKGTWFENLPPCKIGDKIVFKNYGIHSFVDPETGKKIYFLRFHNDQGKTDIMGVYK